MIACIFQTGAVKITPAHDQLDYEIGKRHNLPIESCVGQDGCLDLSSYISSDNSDEVNRILKKFHGRNQYDCKEMAIRFLIPKDLYRYIV